MAGKYNEALHPREKSGVRGGWWTFSDAKVEAAARKAAGLDYGTMASTIAEDGGFSTSLSGTSPTTGYMVAITKKNEWKKDVKDLTDADVYEYAANNLRGLMYKDYYLGGWLSGTKACLDISKNVFSSAEAIKIAIRAHQDEIYIVDSPGPHGDHALKRGRDYDW